MLGVLVLGWIGRLELIGVVGVWFLGQNRGLKDVSGVAFLKLCSLLADTYVIDSGRFSGGALRGASRWRNRSEERVSLKHV